MGDHDSVGFDPVIELDGVRVFHGDCVEVLRSLPDNSVDSVVTDPPYGLEFMGKDWDAPWKNGKNFAGNVEATATSAGGALPYSAARVRYHKGQEAMVSFQQWTTEWSVECLRVLKPGGHLLAFGGTRTWHRLAVAIEDAGFEIRDNIAWMYGSGFPKSLDVSKAIDKAAGAEREVIGVKNAGIGTGQSYGKIVGEREAVTSTEVPVTAPATPEAEKWAGWGTALKPAFEPIVVARKPLSGTVAETVLEWGTGGLNIDGSRIQSDITKDPNYRPNAQNHSGHGSSFGIGGENKRDLSDLPDAGFHNSQGRWPANVILDEYTADLLDQQSGTSVSKAGGKSGTTFRAGEPGADNSHWDRKGHNDSGGASRFFYCAKASKRDRNEGLDGLEAVVRNDGRDESLASGDMPQNRSNNPKQNFHPTVKPTALMRYLVKLVTPPGGTVLDPFTGSGSTGKAAVLEGFQFVGVELTDDYLPIIEGRLKWASENHDEGTLF